MNQLIKFIMQNIKSILIRKESVTQKAADAIELYQRQFQKNTKGVISKEMTVVSILENYFDSIGKEEKK